MNGSDIGYKFKPDIDILPTVLAFDNCLNWKQEHLNATMRDEAFDYQHREYHTPSGDWETMNFTCTNSFIKSIEPRDGRTFWVCGTFGAFPRAFAVDKSTLDFVQFVDVNVMSCARYIDEPIATFKDDIANFVYVGSGWGLYRPNIDDPDSPDNESQMVYADWRLYRNLFTLPSAMTWVLSSDVNFIKVVKETNDHLYFFGHEINNQYGLNNQEDRHAWQSFMLRICKEDVGMRYFPKNIAQDLDSNIRTKYNMQKDRSGTLNKLSPSHQDMGYNKDWYQNTAHLPRRNFLNPLKINFGCYLGRRPRAISDNHFWGDTNVIYFNQLVDVIYDPYRRVSFIAKSNSVNFGCLDNMHSQIPLVGLFNSPGIQETHATSSGAICQLQINENIFKEAGINREPYDEFNQFGSMKAHEEIMALSSTSYSNIFSRTLHRTNGFALYPYWNQGVMIGRRDSLMEYDKVYAYVGICDRFSADKQFFLQLQNYSNIAWPNELPNRLTSVPVSVCQFAAAELYSFNATFVLKDVQFKRIFLLQDNIVTYHMYDIPNSTATKTRILTSPLMIVVLISTTGYLYRVVLCDFDNGMSNYGDDMTLNEWYNWCIFRHTDQPYLYRQYAPMERREWGESYQYRASSLLLQKKIIKESDEFTRPNKKDPNAHIVKDMLRKGDYLHLITANNIYSINLQINCKQDYSTCIDCASDPDCMWSIDTASCVTYQTQYEPSLFLQDVLDRGFKCVLLIKKFETNLEFEKMFLKSKSLLFLCTNAGFWRGKIQWKVNGNDIPARSDIYKLNDKEDQLIITTNNHEIQNVGCFGIKDDYDRLFNNKEYEWITADYSIVPLGLYKNGIPEILIVSRSLVLWILFAIILILTFIDVFLFLQIQKAKGEPNPFQTILNLMSRSKEDNLTAKTTSTASEATEDTKKGKKTVPEKNDKSSDVGNVVKKNILPGDKGDSKNRPNVSQDKKENFKNPPIDTKANKGDPKTINIPQKSQEYNNKVDFRKVPKKENTVTIAKDTVAHESLLAKRMEKMLNN